MPGVSAEKLAVHVTGLMPPGSRAVAWEARPLTNTVPLNAAGALVFQAAPSNVVVADVAPGVRVRTVSGTFRVYAVPEAVKVIVWSVTRRVTGLEPTPFTLATLLNQI